MKRKVSNSNQSGRQAGGEMKMNAREYLFPPLNAGTNRKLLAERNHPFAGYNRYQESNILVRNGETYNSPDDEGGENEENNFYG
jgi:hypothetical protein